MFCGECGTQNPDTNQFCKNCGKPLRKPRQAPAPAPAAAVQPAQPVYYQPPPAGVQPQAVPAGAPAKLPLKKGMLVVGILAVIIGIVSFFFYPYICGIAAVVLGGITFVKSGNKKGIVAIIAIIAVVIGIASMVVDHFYFVLFPPPAEFKLLYWIIS